MGLEFIKQYGGRRFTGEADVYEQMFELLTGDLMRAEKKRDELFLIVSAVARRPVEYERYFRSSAGFRVRDICEMMRSAAEKLVAAAREIERIEKALAEVAKNRAKTIKNN